MAASSENRFGSHVMDHFVDPYHRGECEHLTHAAELGPTEENKTFIHGAVRFELQVNAEDTVESAWFEAEGSELLQATASILAEHAEGKSTTDLAAMSLQDCLQLMRSPTASGDESEDILLALTVLQSAIASPVDDDDPSARHTFLGPDFGEES